MSLRLIFTQHGLSLVIGAFATCLFIGLVRGETSPRRLIELKKNQELLAATVSSLRQESAALTEEIARLKESPSYARKVLRDKYHVTDPDEDIVFFVE